MSGRRVGLYFVAFFGFVALVNAVMVSLAIRSHTGLVTDHPYEKGLSYNKVVEAQEKQSALGWRGEVAYQQGILYVALHDKNGQRIMPEKATAYITRPTQDGMDFSVALTGERTAVTFPTKGVWDIRINVLHKDTSYQYSKRIVIK